MTLSRQLQAEVTADQVQIKQLSDRLVVTFVDEVLFAPGSAELHANGRSTIGKAVPTLATLSGHWISVQGYTDSEPIGPALRHRYPTNWDLSAARAVEVVRYLQSQGVDPGNLVAAGYGQYQPVAPNDTAQGRARNRRSTSSCVRNSRDCFAVVGQSGAGEGNHGNSDLTRKES